MLNQPRNTAFVRIILLALFTAIGYTVAAQGTLVLPRSANPTLADEKFDYQNYLGALKDYLVLLKKDPTNNKYNFRVGICYLNTNVNKAEAVPYFEAELKTEKPDKEALFYLGKAYHYAYRFDDAIETFNKYKESGKGNSDNKEQVDNYIQYCLNAKELIKYPLQVKFTNLGKNVNSEFPEYQPFVPEDESYLVYTARRKGAGDVQIADGVFASSVFISKVVNGEFGKTRSIGSPINTGDGDEEVVGLSLSGDIMILVYDNKVSFANLFFAYSDKKGNFRKATAFDKNINSNDQEISASISPDGNTLYFTSTRPGGFGGSDIYVSHKLPNETWAIPQNIGSEINTEADEDFPNISPDGSTLYFSSNGHTGMGGYDIFKADWSETSGKWTNIKNFGYPINTPDDEMNIRFSTTGKHGYIAAVRKEGLGDLDIYRVDFNDVEPNYTLIEGTISSGDTSQKLVYNNVEIKVKNNATQKNYGTYMPNTVTGKYVMILPPGNYTIDIDVQGFEKFSEKFQVADKVNMRNEIEKNITLLPILSIENTDQPDNNIKPK